MKAACGWQVATQHVSDGRFLARVPLLHRPVPHTRMISSCRPCMHWQCPDANRADVPQHPTQDPHHNHTRSTHTHTHTPPTSVWPSCWSSPRNTASATSLGWWGTAGAARGGAATADAAPSPSAGAGVAVFPLRLAFLGAGPTSPALAHGQKGRGRRARGTGQSTPAGA